VPAVQLSCGGQAQDARAHHHDVIGLHLLPPTSMSQEQVTGRVAPARGRLGRSR
jgi:hypothetical protein